MTTPPNFVRHWYNSFDAIYYFIPPLQGISMIRQFYTTMAKLLVIEDSALGSYPIGLSLTNLDTQKIRSRMACANPQSSRFKGLLAMDARCPVTSSLLTSAPLDHICACLCHTRFQNKTPCALGKDSSRRWVCQQKLWFFCNYLQGVAATKWDLCKAKFEGDKHKEMSFMRCMTEYLEVAAKCTYFGNQVILGFSVKETGTHAVQRIPQPLYPNIELCKEGISTTSCRDTHHAELCEQVFFA